MNITGLSGNEVYCLRQKGWAPGGVVVGNSVQSLGFAGGIGSAFKTMSGGEVANLTELISDGRHAAIARIEREAQNRNAQGVTGVTTEVKMMGGLVEFLAIGSAVFHPSPAQPFFSSACTGQDLYCHLDCGYEPRHLVLGNVAYALGIGRGLTGAFRQFAARGEVKEFSDMYNHTRHLALERIEADARERGCNAVVDISTRVMPFAGAREILMVGTGSHNRLLGARDRPATSELTGEELWNVTQMGYEPVRLVLGSSVYSLGVAGGFRALWKSMARGEVSEISRLIYEARENCIAHIEADAAAHGADEVLGLKVFVAELGSGLIEVLAIGTAVRPHAEVRTESEQLLPQAIIRDRDTFFDETLSNLSRDHTPQSRPQTSQAGTQSNPIGCVIGLVVVALFLAVPCLVFIVIAIFGQAVRH